jgi:hypothetical protein
MISEPIMLDQKIIFLGMYNSPHTHNMYYYPYEDVLDFVPHNIRKYLHLRHKFNNFPNRKIIIQYGNLSYNYQFCAKIVREAIPYRLKHFEFECNVDERNYLIMFDDPGEYVRFQLFFDVA